VDRRPAELKEGFAPLPQQPKQKPLPSAPPKLREATPPPSKTTAEPPTEPRKGKVVQVEDIAAMLLDGTLLCEDNDEEKEQFEPDVATDSEAESPQLSSESEDDEEGNRSGERHVSLTAAGKLELVKKVHAKTGSMREKVDKVLEEERARAAKKNKEILLPSSETLRKDAAKGVEYWQNEIIVFPLFFSDHTDAVMIKHEDGQPLRVRVWEHLPGYDYRKREKEIACIVAIVLRHFRMPFDAFEMTEEQGKQQKNDFVIHAKNHCIAALRPDREWRPITRQKLHPLWSPDPGVEEPQIEEAQATQPTQEPQKPKAKLVKRERDEEMEAIVANMFDEMAPEEIDALSWKFCKIKLTQRLNKKSLTKEEEVFYLAALEKVQEDRK